MSAEVKDFRDNANCLGVNPDIFDGAVPEQTVLAKAVCAMCAVRKECLTYALDNNETEYIWGGQTKEERVQIQQGVRDRDDLSYLYIPELLSTLLAVE